MNIAELKNNAKESLKGKYGEAIKLLFMSFLFSFVVSFVGGLIVGFLGLSEDVSELLNSLCSMIISGVIGFGAVSFFIKISRNEEVTSKELFSKVDMCLPYVIISLVVGIFTIAWSLLFIIPGIIAAISYSLVFYIKLDNPELGTLEVISKSKEMMKGHKWEYFVLGFSFIGWAILGIFTFGLLYLWLTPYMYVTYANFYNYLKQNETTI